MSKIRHSGSVKEEGLQSPYRYWGFISYAHHDARIAKTLKMRLSSMRVPADLRSSICFNSPTFSDLFLDIHDAGADRSLSSELEEALAASRYLIVICSPISRTSLYVNEEIRYFQRIGRGADILCLVGYGVPGAGAAGQPNLECLPIALEEDQYQQPLAAVVGDESEQEWCLAVEKIAAGLSGRSLRDYRLAVGKHKARRLMFISLALVSIVVAAYGILWAYYLPNVSYAKNFARRNGVWVPTKVINAEHASRLDEKYRFIAAGAFGKLRRVELVNRFNRCEGPLKSITGDSFELACSNVRVCAAEFSYVAGQVKEEKLLDQYGNAVETLNYLRPSTAAISEAIIGCTVRPGTIAVVKFERFQSGQHAGLDKKLTFFGLGGNVPAPNADFAYGIEFDYNDAGEVTRITTLNELGQPKVTRNGYATVVRNRSVNELSEAYFDPNGKPATSSKGFHRRTQSLDLYGDHLGAAYYDAAGRPTNSSEGFHRYSVEWRAARRESLMRYFDVRGTPTRSKEGGVHKWLKYDATGGEIETRYYDNAARLVAGGKRYCPVERVSYDAAAGHETRSCFDSAGRPTFDRFGVHVNSLLYNKRGQVQEVRHLGLNNSPVFCIEQGEESGCPVYRMVNEFDEAGNRIRIRFYAPDGTLSPNVEGVAGWDLTYSSTGLEIRRTGIGVDGSPAPSKDNGVRTETRYDQMSRMVSLRFFSADGLPMINAKGIHEYVAEYGSDDKALLHKSLDTNGKVIRDQSGIAVYRFAYDEAGRLRDVRYFDVDARTPVAHNNGEFGVARERDAYGNVTNTVLLGKNGKPEPVSGGLAGYVQEYDAVGRVVTSNTVGKHNELVGTATGISTTRYTYQLGNTPESTKTYGVGGKPAEDQDGIASTISEFNEEARLLNYLGLGRTASQEDIRQTRTS